ncbi:MAG: hypothetical protein EOO27_00660 [Comamonadaceae bacterium]|nr:MAG: hypothetical protein EOO27_00660 [Comamonadaceae bacterium]
MLRYPIQPIRPAFSAEALSALPVSLPKLRPNIWVVGFCAAVLSCAATAQPTGNPAGTARPDVRGEAAKTPATRSPESRGADNPEQRAPVRREGPETNPDNPAARSGHARTPGSGIAGGLSGRHPQGQGKHEAGTDDKTSPSQRRQ